MTGLRCSDKNDYWFVDSVYGNDSNNGKTPLSAFATIAKLMTVYSAGHSAYLARGSSWREQLSIPGEDCKVIAYGTAATPVLDASNVITGFSKTGGRTNVYEKAVTTAAVNGEQYVNAWEDGAVLVRATSVANCDATPGSHYPTAETGNITWYVHPSDSGNPDSNGKEYEVSVRDFGLDSIYDGTVATDLVVQKQQNCSGAIRTGRSAILTDIISYDGNKHNVYIKDGCVLNNVHAIRAYHHSSTKSLFVYNEDVAVGLGITLNDCIADNSGSILLGMTGFYGHNNTSGSFGKITYNRCEAINCYYGFDGIHASLESNDCVTTDCLYYSLVQADGVIPTYTLNRCSCSGITGNAVLVQGSVGGMVITITDCDLNLPLSNNQAIRIASPGIELNVHGNRFNTQYGWLSAVAPTDDLVINSDNNIFIVVANWAAHSNTEAGTITTYTSDHNDFRVSQINNLNNVTYSTLADLFATLAQEEHSTFTP
jgi:hypothetical protein